MYPLLNVTSTLRGFGGKGIPTPDLLIANETLYQLSYTPEIGQKYRVAREFRQASLLIFDAFVAKEKTLVSMIVSATIWRRRSYMRLRRQEVLYEKLQLD